MSTEVDIVAIQQAAEETVCAEYEVARKRLADQQIVLERQRSQWAMIVSALTEMLIKEGKVPEDQMLDADAVMNHLTSTLKEYFELKKVMDTIQGNLLLQSQWDKLVMSIRLTGGDSND